MVTDGSGNNTGLDTRHPLFAFCQEPDSLDRILALDDTCVSGAYAMMCDCPDSILSSLAQRLRDRKRLKCIDVRRDIEQSLSWESISNEQQAIEKACKSIKSKVENWLSEKKSDFPSILTDEGIRVPYKEYDESKGPLNQIRIRVSEKLDAEHIDLRDRSKVVMAIEPFKFNRLYVENDESEKFVHGLIKEEIAYVKKGKSD
jgi:hypothetical protein